MARAALKTRKADLENELNRGRESHAQKTAELIDMALDGTEIENQDKVRRSMVEDLRQVKDALEKIENGNWGICERCEKAIAAKRLEALPWAKLCFICQAKQDLKFLKKNQSPDRIPQSPEIAQLGL